MFWSGEELANRIPAEKLISPFDPSAISCAAYELCLGGEAFVTTDGKGLQRLFRGFKTGITRLKPRDSISIPAGQFAYLLTEETVKIPPDALGFISVKAGKKLDGLINVSGFHVDPGWSSRLIFGVFNAGPRPIVLLQGDRLFLLFYAALDRASARTYTGGANKYENIPATMAQGMSGPVPSLYKLNEELARAKSGVAAAKSQSTMALGLATIAFGFAGTMVGRAFGVFGPEQSQPPPPIVAPAAPAMPRVAPPTSGSKLTAKH